MFPLRAPGFEQELAQNARTFSGWFRPVSPRCKLAVRAAFPSKTAALFVQNRYPSPLAGFDLSPVGPRPFFVRPDSARVTIFQKTKDIRCSRKS